MLEQRQCREEVLPAMCFSIQLASSATIGFWPWLPCAAASPAKASDNNDLVRMVKMSSGAEGSINVQCAAEDEFREGREEDFRDRGWPYALTETGVGRVAEQ